MKGETIKGFVLRAVKKELSAERTEGGGKRAKLPIVKSKEASYELTADRLGEILDQEDRNLFAGH